MHQALRLPLAGLLAACALAGAPAGAQARPFIDPLDLPAQKSELAARSPLMAVARAGDRLVSAGQRGHILYSDDGGAHWTQAAVPVSCDLVALHFADARRGWAVGHEGVVLATRDGGASWSRQLDGRQIGALLVRHYTQRVQAREPDAARWLKWAQGFAAQGPDKPLLDVYFEDERRGFVVGAFNLVLRTEDGGQSWTPWLDRTDNPQELHLYAVRPAGGSLFAVGEQGLVLRLDRDAARWRAVPLPYQGTLFGVLGTAGEVVVFGLRGTALHSADGGASWHRLDTGLRSTLTGGALRADGRVVLVSQAGDVVQGSATTGQGLQRAPLPRSAAFGATEAGPGRLAIAGPRGVRVEALP